jgi:hypothetical protein
MEPERIDLTPLAPGADAFERRIHAIMRAAAPELARRAARDGVLVVLGEWFRPALAAAAVLAAIAAGALLSEMTATEPTGNTSVVQALGVAEPASAWLDEGREPTMSDLEMALMGDAR